MRTCRVLATGSVGASPNASTTHLYDVQRPGRGIRQAGRPAREIFLHTRTRQRDRPLAGLGERHRIVHEVPHCCGSNDRPRRWSATRRARSLRIRLMGRGRCGHELEAPVLTEDASERLRTRRRRTKRSGSAARDGFGGCGRRAHLAAPGTCTLADAAAKRSATEFTALVDPDMPASAQETSRPHREIPVEGSLHAGRRDVRCLLDSLAGAYSRTYAGAAADRSRHRGRAHCWRGRSTHCSARSLRRCGVTLVVRSRARYRQNPLVQARLWGTTERSEALLRDATGDRICSGTSRGVTPRRGCAEVGI